MRAGEACVPLRGRGDRRILFELHGVEHPVHPTGPGRAFARYEDITHLDVSERGLWLGTRRNAVLIPRSAFEDRDGPERIARRLLACIEERPGGREQLARMARVDAAARAAPPPRATWGLVAVCVVVTGLQLAVGEDVEQMGYFSGPLYAAGDYWRVVTANFLHAYPKVPVHLIINSLGVLMIGALCERALGTSRTIAIMAASGLLAMQNCAWFWYPPVVGASGILAGLIGAVTWLEYFRSEDLASWWRLPRRPLLTVLGATVVIDWLIPQLAGAAHIGGFVGGALMTAAVTGRPARARPTPLLVHLLAVVTLLGTLGILGKAAVEVATTEHYAARNLERLVDMPDVTEEELNAVAWAVATAPDVEPFFLESALVVAQRAVELSERQSPHILDTLAEVYFVLGDVEAALAAIDEALALEPDDDYYQSQRRRFLGETDPDAEEGPAAETPGAPTE